MEIAGREWNAAMSANVVVSLERTENSDALERNSSFCRARRWFKGLLASADPPLPPASVVNSTTSTTPTMEDLLIGGVGHLQVLDPLGSAPS